MGTNYLSAHLRAPSRVEERREAARSQSAMHFPSFLKHSSSKGKKKRIPQQKSCLLHAPPSPRREQLGDKSLLLAPSDSSDALNPGPQVTVPGLAARGCRMLPHSLPQQNGKRFPALGLRGQRRSKGRVPASCQLCSSQQLFARIWEARNAGELQSAKITSLS